jgi:hypothetical protein
VLWQQLDTPKSEQDAFSQGVDGLGLETIRAGEAELKRLK